MKKKVVSSLVLILIFTVAMMASGCMSQVLYGSWQLSYYMDSDGGSQNDYSMALTFDINKDGTITMGDQLIGTYEKNGSQFSFTWAVENQQGTVTGAWELQGTELFIYMDDSPTVHVLKRVTASQQ